MLSLPKSLVLVLLSSASVTQAVLVACTDEMPLCPYVGCGETGPFTGSFLITAANSTYDPGCTAKQYAYVTEVIITGVTVNSGASFDYAINPSADYMCMDNGQACESLSSLTCGKGSDKNATVTITCDKQCELKYYISWECADLTSSDTSDSSSSSSSSNSTSSSTAPNAAWAPVSASLLGLATTVVAALFQI